MPWYTERVVPFPQIQTADQAMAYVHAEYKVALRDCPSSAAKYKSVRDQVQSGIVGMLGQPLIQFGQQILLDKLKAPRQACIAEKAAAGKPATPPSDAEVTSQKLDDGPMGPPAPAGLGKGMPWWLWGLLGVGLYYAYKKMR